MNHKEKALTEQTEQKPTGRRFLIWENSNELKTKYGNASIISSKRVVFNIKGNDYRLIVEIEYKLKIVFVVWFGTHADYDRIDAKTIEYER